jgi:hypothetical protein
MGAMDEMFSRGWDDLLARDGGPLHFRLILQPLMATLLAIRAGRRSAEQGRRPFFRSMVGEPARRPLLLRELWRDEGKLFLVAVVLDVIYSILVLHWWYPVQTLIVALLLAIVPYLVLRGLLNRIVTRLRPRPPSGINDRGLPPFSSG